MPLAGIRPAMLDCQVALVAPSMSETTAGTVRSAPAAFACGRDLRRAVTLGLAILAAACGGSPTGPTPVPPTRPAGKIGLTLTCPADVHVTSPDGLPFAVTFAPDTTGGLAPVTESCNPASGSAFALGTTQVSCTAKDSVGQVVTCQFAVVVAPPPRIRYTTYMAFGDSITEGKVTTEPAFLLLDTPESYPNQLRQLFAARYPTQTITVVNAGLGGENARSAMPRFLDALAQWQPEVVLLMEGTNDLNGGGTAVIADAAAAVEDMALAATARGMTVLVGTIPPMRPGGLKALCPECVVPFNDRLTRDVPARGIRVVDIYAALVQSIDISIGPDGVHPTAAGYKTMAHTYFDAIRAAFESAPSGAGLKGYAVHASGH